MSQLKSKFEKDGFLVMKDFYSADQCNALIRRANEISNHYEFNGGGSVFQTTEQSRTTDEYFLESGNNISFFFEKDAFDKSGKLINSVEKSFNKIGHALHDLDDTFNEFLRSTKLKDLSTELGYGNHHLIQSMFIFKHAKIGGVVDVHQDLHWRMQRSIMDACGQNPADIIQHYAPDLNVNPAAEQKWKF